MTRFTIDFSTSVPFEHFWRGTGFSPAELILTPDMQQALAWTGSVPHQGILYYRVHFLLELVDYSLDSTGQPVFAFDLLDQALATLLKNGGRPFFELMGNPSAFFNDFNDLRQLNQWKDLIAALASHLIERFGRDEVLSWAFETWNEPDGSGWWKQWPADETSFCNYFDACCAGLWSVEPRLRMGGPGTCRHLSSLLKTFLAHLDSGRSCLDMQVPVLSGAGQLRIDFISFHEKGARSHAEELTPNIQGICDREAAIITYIRAHHARLAAVPLMNNECDPQVGWWNTHTWHATAYYPAIAARIIHQHLCTLVDSLGADYDLLSNDNGFIGYWGNRTLVTRFGAEAFTDTGQSHHKPGSIREMRLHGRPPFSMVKKPILNAMVLFSLLGDRRCPVSGGTPELDVLATSRGSGQVALLVYHSRDRVASSGEAAVTLALEGLPFEKAILAHYRIDAHHNHPFAVWEAAASTAGGPNPDQPGVELLAAMRREQEIGLLEAPGEVEINQGSLRLSFTLPLPGLSLVLLTTRPDEGPGKIERLWVESYTGLHGREDFIRWQGLDTRALRSYVVEVLDPASGEYQQINQTDLMCNGYLHAVSATMAGPLTYRVRAVDYWGRSGEPAEFAAP